jgi:hypothetical protein
VRAKELGNQVRELEAALEEARRGQDGGIELAERCKRAESDLERARERCGALESQLVTAQGEAAKVREETATRIASLEGMLSEVSPGGFLK